ncbi:hypothetical protein BT63DRAFT_419686 [Microthyrium microscopicum]|uniref:Cenp-O kinetochore centromere component n=1 Tax=Microthyrium microscopicum TaxID=703497 RepID=A0A6A6UTY0_9PEZI|nr:hypothetical protein BT63DRAFT_419686 [Microthyrium microscopicum]
MNSAIDTEIAQVRAQIEALRHRKSLLSTSLIGSRRTKLALQSYDSAQKPPGIDRALATLSETSSAIAANNARITAGITAFRVKDPDPNAVNNGKILGVRLDLYSTGQNSFVPPYYLLFRQFEDGVLKLHQHTIPACISLRPILRKHMPTKDEDESAASLPGHSQDLHAFAKGVRKELVGLTTRSDKIEALKQSYAFGAHGRYCVKDVKAYDPGASNIELELRDGTLVKLLLRSSGDLDKVTVRMPQNADIDEKRRIEKAILECSDRIESICRALKDMKQ